MSNKRVFLCAMDLYLKLIDKFRLELSRKTNHEEDDEIENVIFAINIYHKEKSLMDIRDKEKVKKALEIISKMKGMDVKVSFDKLNFYIHFRVFDKLKNKELSRKKLLSN